MLKKTKSSSRSKNIKYFTSFNFRNLGNNMLHELPTAGLQKLRVVKVHNNVELTTFPSHLSLPNVHTLVLSYAYHCCSFLYQYESDPLAGADGTHGDAHKIKESVIWMEHTDVDLDLWSRGIANRSIQLYPGFNGECSRTYSPCTILELLFEL